MKVSVIVRTYNRGYVLGQALRSILNQTYKDYELIVVDDGSTDDTKRVVQEIGGDKVRYIRHPHNRGVSAAFNTGIAAATGELIGALDSDDLWKPEKLEREVAFMDTNPEVDLVFSDVEIVTGKGIIPSLFGIMQKFQSLSQTQKVETGNIVDLREMYLCLLEEVPIKPSAALVRRGVFDKVGIFDETSQSGEDWDFYIRSARVSRFGYIDIPLTIQKWSDDSTHRNFWEADKQFLLKRFLIEKRRLAGDTEALDAINRGISSHCNNLAYGYLYSGRRKQALAACYRGFVETHEIAFLLRGLAATMPLGLREFLRVPAKKLLRSSR